MAILLTGGAGFIGSHTAVACLAVFFALGFILLRAADRQKSAR